MMSEKRFRLAEDSNGLYSIFDTEDKEDEPLIYGARFGTEKIVGLLNEQQATISALKEENIELKKLRKYCAEWMGVKEENLYDVVR